jgi:hypothetical protein
MERPMTANPMIRINKVCSGLNRGTFTIHHLADRFTNDVQGQWMTFLRGH